MSHLTDEQLSALLDDALAPSARAECDAHLAACEPCRDRLAGLAALERDLGAALTHDPGEAYFASFAGRVARRIAAAPAARAPSRSPRGWRLSPRGLSLAGGVAALLVTAGVAWLRFRGEDDAARALRAAAPPRVGAKARDESAAPPSVPAPPHAVAQERAPAQAVAPSLEQRAAAPGPEAGARSAREVKTSPTGEPIPVTRNGAPGEPQRTATPGPAAGPLPFQARMKQRALLRAGQAPAPTPAERPAWSEAKRRFASPPPPAASSAPAPAAAPSAADLARAKDQLARAPETGALAKSAASQETEAAKGEAVGVEPAPLAVRCGRVTDARGTPIGGAEIMLLGATTRSARSAADGSFCLPDPVEGDTLVLMRVGFQPLRIVLAPSTSLALGLEPVGTLGPRDGMLLGGRAQGFLATPRAAPGVAPAPDVYASQSAAVRASVTDARDRTAIARRERSAGAWETAAARWDAVALAVSGAPAWDARFQSLSALREAQRVAPTAERAERLRAALAAFVRDAPRALPERDTVLRWQGRGVANTYR